MILLFEEIICPKCRLKTAIKRCFGRRGHCFNCNHDWQLKWKGGKSFSVKVRQEYV